MIGAIAKARSPRPGAAWIATLLGSARQLYDAVVEVQRAIEERAQLLALNERELRDIGITRNDALREAERPLLRWRSH